MKAAKQQHHTSALHSLMAIRLSAILALAFFPPFWILDHYIVPEHVETTGIMRFVCSIVALVILWMSYFRRRWIRKYQTFLGMLLGVMITSSISIMCWLHLGYESPYYAGINTVVIVVGMVFSWSLWQSVFFSIAIYVFYMSPLILGFIEINDLPTVLSNQFFLVTTIVLAAFSQQFRVRAETRDFLQRRTLKKYLAQVRILASRDSLTNLYNRRHLLLLAETELSRCIRHSRPFTVLIADIDHFKKINDTHTHKTGDEVIRAVSQILQRSVRNIDIVGRYGGEEFLIILPDTEEKVAHDVVANRIHAALRASPIQTTAVRLPVTLSIGVSGRELHDQISLEDLIWRADVALYQAKETGRNRSVCWSDVTDHKHQHDAS